MALFDREVPETSGGDQWRIVINAANVEENITWELFDGVFKTLTARRYTSARFGVIPADAAYPQLMGLMKAVAETSAFPDFKVELFRTVDEATSWVVSEAGSD